LTIDIFEVSNILNTGLDRKTLATCIQMIEAGVNPESLAAVVRELKRESSIIRPN
jgi:mitotic-spindle organizing protein 1